MKKVIRYETTDGELFKEEVEAKVHQEILNKEALEVDYNIIITIEEIKEYRVSHTSSNDIEQVLVEVKNLYKKDILNNNKEPMCHSWKPVSRKILSIKEE